MSAPGSRPPTAPCYLPPEHRPRHQEYSYAPPAPYAVPYEEKGSYPSPYSHPYTTGVSSSTLSYPAQPGSFPYPEATPVDYRYSPQPQPYRHGSHPAQNRSALWNPISPYKGYPPPPSAVHPSQIFHTPRTIPPDPPRDPTPPVRIKIKRPDPQPTNVPPGDMTGTRNSRSSLSHTVVKTEPYSAPSSSRPVREARLNAQHNRSAYREVNSDEDADGEDALVMNDVQPAYPADPYTSRSGRAIRPPEKYKGEDDFEDRMVETSPVLREAPRRVGRLRGRVADPDDEEGEEDYNPQPTRNSFHSRPARNPLGLNRNAGPGYRNINGKSVKRDDHRSKLAGSRHSSADAESFEPSGSETEGDVSEDPLQRPFDEEDDLESRSRSPSPAPRRARSTRTAVRGPVRRSTRQSTRANQDQESDDDFAKPKRQLRQRTSKVNYELPPLDISAEVMQDAIAGVARPNGRGIRFGTSTTNKGIPWSLKVREMAQAMGDPDTSDSDLDFASPMKNAAAAGPSRLGGPTAPTDVLNFGRINPKSSTADADPLGVDMNVTFDNVGGLDDHINQLKEMVALPLLYPELFQQFGITPPRGVLFHGPPGTGKTLLARALAASCSTGNTKIAFFMRKGADVLSKWVGEAERQLRMLFEEARAAQPSIIFFDEIDGLAPVRSSKQDQIHASLVSTLLALMDGMDGRGQVIVIGATNRPDAVDSALRRPGRFDREFYFPLPNRTARKEIIGINTREWEPKLSDEFLDQLAILTKGYGGADLRALCTEAALNAIQRRYPQIYQSTDRLLLNPGSIHVKEKDFMLSIKKIVPSSARSTASPAIPLPGHLLPLLAKRLDRLTAAVDVVLPPSKPRTALEEAEYEDEGVEGFDQHLMVQSLDKLRTFRPRVLVHGPAGMGQAYLGPAVLHHLEGFHVLSLDLGSLMGDSTRTVEATLVQLFVEAKRHQPSILFIPSLGAFASILADAARTTFRALLDGIPSSDPVLLLAITEGDVEDLPRDVRGWFGFGNEIRIQLVPPSSEERAAYFSPLIETLQRSPSDFPDAIPRRKRLLSPLPLAPALPPRVPSEAELAREAERDNNARNMLVVSFTALVGEFLKKYRKVVASVKEDAMAVSKWFEEQAAAPAEAAAVLAADPLPVDGVHLPSEVLSGGATGECSLPPNGDVSHHPIVPPAEPSATNDSQPISSPKSVWQAHDVDIDTLQRKLVRHRYFTPSDFLADIALIEDNAAHLNDPDRQAKVAEMAANSRLHVSGFDAKWTPEFERYKERMKTRKAEREKRKADEKGKSKDVVVVEGEVGEIAESGTLKRVREDDGEDGRVEKRKRENGMELDVPTPSQASRTGTIDTLIPSIPINTPSRALPQQTTTTIPPVPPATIPSPRPAPLPTYPPFILPSEFVAGLAADLKHTTSQLNVDQLEQLRARCFDRIWRRRGDWDRRELAVEIEEVVRGYVEEAEKAAEEDME